MASSTEMDAAEEIDAIDVLAEEIKTMFDKSGSPTETVPMLDKSVAQATEKTEKTAAETVPMLDKSVAKMKGAVPKEDKPSSSRHSRKRFPSSPVRRSARLSPVKGKVSRSTHRSRRDSYGERSKYPRTESRSQRRQGSDGYKHHYPSQDTRRSHRDSADRDPKRPRFEERHYRSRVDLNACPIPKCQETISREHAFGAHLPMILDERKGLTAEITRSRRNLLLLVCQRIVTRLDAWVLARYINSLQLLTKGCFQVSKLLKTALDALCQEMKEESPETYAVDPINCPAIMIHWRVFLVIMGCLDRDTRQEIREQYPAIIPPLADRPAAMDSHFHVDRISKRMGGQASWHEIMKFVEPKAGDEVNIVGGVAVFCDPKTYPTQDEVDELRTKGVGVAIGLHPKSTSPYTEDDWSKFTSCLQFEGVCGLGEIGLDHYKTQPTTWDEQHNVVDRAVSHLQEDKVLILHNRGDGKSEMLELLYHLKGVVPKKQAIHLHCYNSSASTRDMWIREFPNTSFGFTGLVNHFNATQKEALKTLDPERLLLETDSPYFSLEGQSISTPVNLGTVARMVAEIRGETWNEVLRVSAENTQKLYGLQQ